MPRRRGDSLQLATEEEAVKVRKIHFIIKCGLYVFIFFYNLFKNLTLDQVGIVSVSK
jgi:hypothetical protein